MQNYGIKQEGGLAMKTSRTKRLLTVRHGDYDSNMSLSDLGVKQIYGISAKILPLVKGKTAIILSSPEERAVQSAAIIACQLGLELQEHDVLWSESRHPENFPEALKLVRSFMGKVDIIILVTHYEYVEYFPHYFAAEQLNTPIRSEVIRNGCMWDLEWETVPRLEKIYPS